MTCSSWRNRALRGLLQAQVWSQRGISVKNYFSWYCAWASISRAAWRSIDWNRLLIAWSMNIPKSKTSWRRHGACEWNGQNYDHQLMRSGFEQAGYGWYRIAFLNDEFSKHCCLISILFKLWWIPFVTTCFSRLSNDESRNFVLRVSVGWFKTSCLTHLPLVPHICVSE